MNGIRFFHQLSSDICFDLQVLTLEPGRCDRILKSEAEYTLNHLRKE